MCLSSEIPCRIELSVKNSLLLQSEMLVLALVYVSVVTAKESNLLRKPKYLLWACHLYTLAALVCLCTSVVGLQRDFFFFHLQYQHCLLHICLFHDLLTF